MFSRESKFFNNVSKRGFVKTASINEEKQISNDDKAKDVLNKFDKSDEIPETYVNEHKERITKGEHPTEVMSDFFQGLHEVKAGKEMTIKTAKLFRQAGIFKVAEKSVYQDLETGNFWKIQNGKVIRMFEELDGGIADRISKKHTSVIKLASTDPIIEKIGDIVKTGKNLVDLRKPLEQIFNKKDIDFSFMPVAHFRIKYKGKVIVIVNKKYADDIDLEVDDIAIGYEKKANSLSKKAILEMELPKYDDMKDDLEELLMQIEITLDSTGNYGQQNKAKYSRLSDNVIKEFKKLYDFADKELKWKK